MNLSDRINFETYNLIPMSKNQEAYMEMQENVPNFDKETHRYRINQLGLLHKAMYVQPRRQAHKDNIHKYGSTFYSW